MTRIDQLPAPRLDVKDLEVALALASEGTTARAAGTLALTQSAVSRALIAVEEKLGVRLFERTPRGLVATAEGARLVEGAAKLLCELRELERSVRERPAAPTRLRVVCSCYTAYHWLPSVLASLRAVYPDLDVKLAVDRTSDPFEALVRGDVDVALLTTPGAAEGTIEQRELFDDEVVFLVAPSHPLAQKRALAPRDIRAARIVTTEAPRGEVEWFMKRVFGRARPRLRSDVLPLSEAVIDLARAGMGVGVLSEWVVRPYLGRGDLIVKRLASGPLRRPWRIAWRKEVRPAARRLMEALERTTPRSSLGGRALG
jgi:LysR family transcriptional regulator for metE and metH